MAFQEVLNENSDNEKEVISDESEIKEAGPLSWNEEIPMSFSFENTEPMTTQEVMKSKEETENNQVIEEIKEAGLLSWNEEIPMSFPVEDVELVETAEVIVENKDKPREYDFRNNELMSALEKQVDIPSDQWTPEAKAIIHYIRTQKKRVLMNYEEPSTVQEKLRDSYEYYLNDFDLDEDDLKDKKIVDIGCASGDFVIHCLENGVTEDIYGIEKYKQMRSDDLEFGNRIDNDQWKLFEKYDGHILDGDYHDGIPLENVDYILARATMGALGGDLKNRRRVIKLIEDSLGRLNENGEFKIFPISKDSLRKEQDFDNYEFWKGVAEEITDKTGMKHSFTPTDIGFAVDYDNTGRFSVKEALTFIKKHRGDAPEELSKVSVEL
ncbi:MAG: hypothetical protein PHW52_04520 [Candidatus Pacebacteria bacterium]|nr:hypothetical protein [Candidatus Paceibacterota bacterium]